MIPLAIMAANRLPVAVVGLLVKFGVCVATGLVMAVSGLATVVLGLALMSPLAVPLAALAYLVL